MEVKSLFSIARLRDTNDNEYIEITFENPDSSFKTIRSRISLSNFTQALTGLSSRECYLDIRDKK